MAKSNERKRHEQAIKGYLIRQFYEGFPDSKESQRQMVKFFYDFVWGNKDKIRVEDAKDIRVYSVAQELWHRSKDLSNILTEEQKELLQHEVEYKRTGKYSHCERVGIMLDSQYSLDPEFSDTFVEITNSQKYKNFKFR